MGPVPRHRYRVCDRVPPASRRRPSACHLRRAYRTRAPRQPDPPTRVRRGRGTATASFTICHDLTGSALCAPRRTRAGTPARTVRRGGSANMAAIRRCSRPCGGVPVANLTNPGPFAAASSRKEGDGRDATFDPSLQFGVPPCVRKHRHRRPHILIVHAHRATTRAAGCRRVRSCWSMAAHGSADWRVSAT